MQQRLSLITLGVENLQIQREFYTRVFGWEPVAENKDIIFFKLNGILFSILDRETLAKGSGVASEGTGFRALTLAYNVDSREEIDNIYNDLLYKGIKVLKAPEETLYGGYAFTVADPEGNVFEFACNPYLILDEAGNVVTHLSISDL